MIHRRKISFLYLVFLFIFLMFPGLVRAEQSSSGDNNGEKGDPTLLRGPQIYANPLRLDFGITSRARKFPGGLPSPTAGKMPCGGAVPS